MQKVALNLTGLVLLVVLVFALFRFYAPERTIVRCEVFTERLVRDPFSDERAFSSSSIGSIEANKWSSDLNRLFNDTIAEAPQIPAVGVVATLHFIDDNNRVVAEGRIYLPNGDLIFSVPRQVKLRLTELNGQVLSLLQSKDPETFANLESQLKTRSMSLEQLKR